MNNRFICADVYAGMRKLPDNTFPIAITSPPYWARKKYTDSDDEIGQGDLSYYLETLVDVFGVMRRKLTPDGVFWLNIGDTASRSGGAGGDYNRGGRYEGRRKYKQGRSGLPGGQWCDVPGRLLHDLQDDGWICRAKIVWDKDRCRPEDRAHVRRPLESYEMIYMLAVNAKTYHFNHAPLGLLDLVPEIGIELGDVWRIPPNREKVYNQAPFPTEIPKRCIDLAGKDGPVLDIFGGSGATAIAAKNAGRKFAIIDIDKESIDDARRRVAAA